MRLAITACLLFLFAITGHAQVRDTDILVMIETPVQNSTNANISGIRGWTLHPTERVEVVEIYVDDVFTFEVPVGGQRVDVLNAFPSIPDAEYSGYGQTVNFKNWINGKHRVVVMAYTSDGDYNWAETEFCVNGFIEPFISDPEEIQLTNVRRIHVWDNRLILEGIRVEGLDWNVEMTWNTATQSFEISQTTAYTMVNANTKYACEED